MLRPVKANPKLRRTLKEDSARILFGVSSALEIGPRSHVLNREPDCGASIFGLGVLSIQLRFPGLSLGPQAEICLKWAPPGKRGVRLELNDSMNSVACWEATELGQDNRRLLGELQAIKQDNFNLKAELEIKSEAANLEALLKRALDTEHSDIEQQLVELMGQRCAFNSTKKKHAHLGASVHEAHCMICALKAELIRDSTVKAREDASSSLLCTTASHKLNMNHRKSQSLSHASPSAHYIHRRGVGDRVRVHRLETRPAEAETIIDLLEEDLKLRENSNFHTLDSTANSTRQAQSPAGARGSHTDSCRKHTCTLQPTVLQRHARFPRKGSEVLCRRELLLRAPRQGPSQVFDRRKIMPGRSERIHDAPPAACAEDHQTAAPGTIKPQAPSDMVEFVPHGRHDEDGPIELGWAFGYDKSVRNGVHSLSKTSEGPRAVFFPASNTGVVHIYQKKGENVNSKDTQLHLRGHTNRISAVAVSEDKELIATGDIGQETLLIIWSASKAERIKVYKRPHPMGVCSVDFTPDARLIATLSALIPETFIRGKAFPQQASVQPDGECQEESKATHCSNTNSAFTEGAGAGLYQGVAIWNWRDAGQASCVCCIATDAQHEIWFNPWDVNEVLTNGRRRVLFWYWRYEDVTFHFYSPALQSKLFKQKIGDITTSTFVPRSTKAITGTTDGDVVIWNLSLILDGLSRPDERRAVSILRLRNSCVMCLKTFKDQWIVAGFADGGISFYDPQLRLIRCFEDIGMVRYYCTLAFLRFQLACILSGSSYLDLEDSSSRSKRSTAPQHEWITDVRRLPPFLISTSKAKIVEVFPTGLANGNEKVGVEVVFEGLDASPTTIVLHPHEPILVVAGATGKQNIALELWNTISHSLLGNVVFEKLSPTAAAFSPSGTFLAVGFSSGTLKIYEFRPCAAASMLSADVCGDVKALVELFVAKESREAVINCMFSPDSAHLAAAYRDNVICLFRFDCRLGNPQLPAEWSFAGKHQSHRRAICGLTFIQANGPASCLQNLPAASNTSTAIAAAASQSFASRPAQPPLATVSPRIYIKGYPRLFSIGEDRRLVEYDVPNSFEHTGLLQRRCCTVEQSAMPTGCLALPSAVNDADVDVLVYSSDAKAKLWSANAMACVKTASVLMSSGGIWRFALQQSWCQTPDEEKRAVLLLACKDSLLGLRLLPLDGNPYGGLDVVAHAGPIVALAASAPRDGCTMVFTCGGNDFTVLKWHVNHAKALKKLTEGPKEADALLQLIPGGKTGAFYRTAKDYFYYAQLRSQGEHATRPRRLDGSVPITEIPNLLCALGENPTLLELDSVLGECGDKESTLHRQSMTGVRAASSVRSEGRIGFEQFLSLYMNHRAPRSFEYSDIVNAFKQLTKGSDASGVPPDRLVNLLLTKGEMMSEAELAYCLEMSLPLDLPEERG
ncbi:hypothetical protein Efla_002870 [Eimeria flavescens]